MSDSIKQMRRDYLYRIQNQPLEVISKTDAVCQGYNKYYTGDPCKYGHLDLRYVKTGMCRTCSKKYKENRNSKL
jgi:hypothetical protein